MPAYCSDFAAPNPLREQAKGRPMFRLRVIPWSDDVSGNVSKQYNAHTNIYMTNANLPHSKLSQEYFIRFCSTSSNASSSEQFATLQEDLYVPHCRFHIDTDTVLSLHQVRQGSGMMHLIVTSKKTFSFKLFVIFLLQTIPNNQKQHRILASMGTLTVDVILLEVPMSRKNPTRSTRHCTILVIHGLASRLYKLFAGRSG